MMGKRFVAVAMAVLLALAALLTGGCDTQKIIEEVVSQAVQEAQESTTETSAASADIHPESTEEPDGAFDASGEQAFSMADLKQLKNTQNFAKNTLEHIFNGTINKKGKATGYHYTGIIDADGSVIPGTESKPDKNGVFTAKVEVNGVKKNGFSSFYPESWTPQQVVDAINTAYSDALKNKKNPTKSDLWIGYCGDLEIDMYLNNSKKITTAFPVYEGD